MQDAPQNVRNFTAFYKSIILFPSFYITYMGEEEALKLYETALVWQELTSTERKNALQKAKQVVNGSVE